jgi:hypothetical protein
MRDQVSLEPCVTCDKRDCGATTIVSALPAASEYFNYVTNCLDIPCSACARIVSVPISQLEWLQVEERELSRGFFDPSHAYKLRQAMSF